MTHHDQLSEVQEELKSGQFSCAEMVEAFLKKIEAHQNLNAFLEVFAHDARSRATVIDAKLQHGTAGRLAGLVIGIKDNIAFKGHKFSAASKILEGFESLFSATVVERLLEEDAIIIGRLNCDEFAMGSSNEFSAFGPVKNPVKKSTSPGGSSGGSAAAVAAGLCHASLGSDTGGSIRQPASFTGIYGFKPTYGRVSRHGLIAFASSFDQIGPFARSPEVLNAIYEVISGPDHFDSTASQKEVELVPEPLEKPSRIAFIKDTLTSEHIDPEVREQTREYIEKLKDEGHTVEPIDFPMLDYLVPVYMILAMAEASSNLARYDGVHYGYRSEEISDLESVYKNSRTEGFGEEVKRRIMIGTFVLSSGYYEAYYGKAQKARGLILEKTQEIFADYDFILSPTTPHPAFKLGAKDNDPVKMYLEDIFTVHANLCGLPAVSLPLFKNEKGMPFGLQLTAPAFADAQLLSFAGRCVN